MSGPIYDITVDYYAALGVGKSATEEEIRDAYRRLAKRLHPDVNPSNPHATEHFKQPEKAYAALKNALIRRDYDNARSERLNPRPEPTATVTEQYFNCPHCQTPNVMPLEGLTIQSLCGNCHQPLLGMPTHASSRPIPVPQPYSSTTFTAPDTAYTSTLERRRRQHGTSIVLPVLLGAGVLFTLLLLVCVGSLVQTDDTTSGELPASDETPASRFPANGSSQVILGAHIIGPWTAEWSLTDADGDPGTARWDLLFSENGSFVLDITGSTVSGKQSKEPRYSGTWYLASDRVFFSKPIPFPSASSGVEQVEVIELTFPSEATCSFTYGPDRTTVSFNRSYGHRVTPYFPSEAERHRALMEEASTPGLWTYSMNFDFQRDHGAKPVALDIETHYALSPYGEKVIVVDDGAAGKAIKINGGRIAINTGTIAAQGDWTLSLCFKPESLAVESILYGEMDKAGSDLFDIILSREGHVYLAVWNEGYRPEPWQKTLLTTKRCEVGKWAGILLHRRDGRVYGHVNHDTINIDMQKSSRRTSQTDIGRNFHGVVDEVYVAGHRMSSKAWEGLAAHWVGVD